MRRFLVAVCVHAAAPNLLSAAIGRTRSEGFMAVRTAPWIELAMLPLLLILWNPFPDYEMLVQLAVFVSACAVAFQTGKESRYFLTTAFVGLAVLFNPVAPVMLSHVLFLWVCWASVGMFVFTLTRLKKRERMPMVSIADAVRRTESIDAF